MAAGSLSTTPTARTFMTCFQGSDLQRAGTKPEETPR